MSENKVNHPNHYVGSSAESWDLTVLEWGPEYAIAAWVIQAQQYYDRHLQKNGLEDLEKALEFINHAEDVYKFYNKSSNDLIVDMDPYDFWQRVDFLKKMITKACVDLSGEEPAKKDCKDDTDDGLASFTSKCNSSWIVGMDLGSKDNK